MNPLPLPSPEKLRQELARKREAQRTKWSREVAEETDETLRTLLSERLSKTTSDIEKASREEDESSAQRAEETEVLVTALACDAQAAWDSGERFYLPVVALSVDARRTFGRAIVVEKTLSAVTSIGWKLHTWSVEDSIAQPLFIRE